MDESVTGEGAPVLAALLVRDKNGREELAVWCRYCENVHWHGNTEGHRAAHCFREADSPYVRTGYVLKRVGETTLANLRLWEKCQKPRRGQAQPRRTNAAGAGRASHALVGPDRTV
jgi:hypothetical protein